MINRDIIVRPSVSRIAFEHRGKVLSFEKSKRPYPSPVSINVPTNLLRGFVAIIDSGSMLQAADQVFVSQSALSLQIKRLEELVQQTLFIRDGRRLVLTDRGEVLLGYARRLLALHDEAIEVVAAGSFAGPVRIGMVQDFAEALLPGLLGHFTKLHPEAQLFARIAGTAEMLEMLERGALDIVLGYGSGDDPTALRVAPMAWHGAPALAEHAVVPLAVLESPCRFREAAMSALDAAGRHYRVAVETPNLSTLRAAVQAGLGLTCRTPMFLPERETGVENMPPLPNVACIVRTAPLLEEAAARLAQLSADAVRSVEAVSMAALAVSADGRTPD
jgi:DNA-binding transcriptional LysR family regulator